MSPLPLTTPDCCPGCEELAAWLDDGVTVLERARIDAHLAHCAICRRVVERVQDCPIDDVDRMRFDTADGRELLIRLVLGVLLVALAWWALS